MSGAAAKSADVISIKGKKPRSPGRRKRDRDMAALVTEIFESYQALGHPCKNPSCRSLACKLTRRAGDLLERKVKTFDKRHR